MVLAAMMVLTWPAVRDRVLKMHCQTNLYKCQKILFEYGANYGGYLPPMSGSNPMGSIREYTTPGIPEQDQPHGVAKVLKSFGAGAEEFTCPASPVYGDTSHYMWDSWRWRGVRNVGGNRCMYVWTHGYVFFMGFWPSSDNRRLYSTFHHLGGKAFADRVDSPGNPPLGADLMMFDSRPYGTSRIWKGFHHKRDNSEDTPGGGGHTVWLNGSINWLTWDELEAGEHTDPSIQPVWHGASSWHWYYYAGWEPREDR